MKPHNYKNISRGYKIKYWISLSIDGDTQWYCHRKKRFVKDLEMCREGIASLDYSVRTMKKAKKVMRRICAEYDKGTIDLARFTGYVNSGGRRGHVVQEFEYII